MRGHRYLAFFGCSRALSSAHPRRSRRWNQLPHCPAMITLARDSFGYRFIKIMGEMVTKPAFDCRWLFYHRFQASDFACAIFGSSIMEISEKLPSAGAPTTIQEPAQITSLQKATRHLYQSESPKRVVYVHWEPISYLADNHIVPKPISVVIAEVRWTRADYLFGCSVSSGSYRAIARGIRSLDPARAVRGAAARIFGSSHRARACFPRRCPSLARIPADDGLIVAWPEGSVRGNPTLSFAPRDA